MGGAVPNSDFGRAAFVSADDVSPVDQNADEPDGPAVMKALPEITDLVTLLTSLSARVRGRWQQPMLCFVGPGASAMLELLSSARERQRPYAVPCAFVDASQADDLRQLLIELAETWEASRTSQDRIRFRHFRLIDWLMRQDLTEVRPSQREAELARRLGRASLGVGSDTATEGARVLTGLLGFTLWLVTTILPGMLFPSLARSRLLEIGRVSRWFMRQQYLAPTQTANFWRFALRLTEGTRTEEDPQQVDRLMVHAFLQDLRVEFRRRPWRVRAWRRTVYPVAMIDRVASGNAGSVLLSLINEVRNETGRTDPLLIVAAAQDAADLSADEEFEWLFPLQGLSAGVEAWQRSLGIAWRGQRSTAWYVPVEMPRIERLPEYAQIVPPWRAAAPPLLARRRVLPGLAGLAVLVAASGFGLTWHPDCTSLFKDGRINVMHVAGQCIGYSDNKDHFFGNKNLRKVQEAIFAQNLDAEKRSKNKPDRPYVTIVYFGNLTKPDAEADEETFSAEREELEGIQIAQHQTNSKAILIKNWPILRVLVANAGQEMRYAERVAGMLKELREQDRTIVAVLGLVDSRTWTRKAMTALDEIGLPIVAPTLSGDNIGDGLKYYLQLAPPNKDQARLIHEYATKALERQKILNYYSFGTEDRHVASSDIYVKTLRTDLEDEFGRDNYDEEPWTGQSLTDACADKFKGVVFFGGRYSNFIDFVERLAEDCKGKLPILVADDSVNRYMANVEWRDGAPNDLPLAYVSKGSLAFCERITDFGFRKAVMDQLGRCGPSKKPVGERVGLAYDAVQLLLLAVGRIASAGGTTSEPSLPVEVNRHARILTTSQPYPGVTGPIEFDGEGVAKDKYLALLCAPNIEKAFQMPADVPFEVYHIGQSGRDEKPDPMRRQCHAKD